MESGVTVWLMVMELVHTRMEITTEVIGKTISQMDTEDRSGMTDLNMKANMLMALYTEKANYHLLMVLFIPEHSLKTSMVEMEPTVGHLAKLMTEIGKTTICKDKVVILGLTETNMLVSSRTISPKVKADTLGKMAANTKVAGLMGNKTVQDTTVAITDLQDKACGLMVSYKDGLSDSN